MVYIAGICFHKIVVKTLSYRMMYMEAVLFILILSQASAQDANCDFYQNVQLQQTYYVNSPNHPYNYTPGVQCRWQAVCPNGYNCVLNCPEINIPQTTSCVMDRFLVSKSGDPQLAAAETYCGRGSLNAVSTGQTISMGLITSKNSPGGKVTCQLYAQIAATTPSTCRCGERKQNRIVGGVATGVNEYKMMVGLVDIRIVQIKCGGVIISSRYVLTAAHCVNSQQKDNFVVVVGEHDVTTGDSPGTRAYKIAGFTTHPLYNDNTYDYDIALVKTEIDMEFNDYVGPVCLPFKYVNTNFTGATLTILGWGTVSPGGPSSNVLQKVDVQVISQASCRAASPSTTDRQICTYTPGKDACQDDSGGPLLYTDPKTGLLFSTGIVSSGDYCASKGKPGINTRVTEFLNWIRTTTGSTFCVK